MLTLLRKIRISLIKTGSARKYLLYAVGEILLVVIGILIALQIDNWNEDRKDRAEEIQLLLSLKNEFDRNQFELTFVKQNHQKTLDACIASLKSFGQKDLSIDKPTLEAFVIASYSLPVYYPINSATNSIVSSGKLELLQNEELKSFLNQWEFYCRRYGNNILLQPKSITDQLLENRSLFFPIRNFGYDGDWVRKGDVIGPTELEHNTKLAFRNPELENLLESKRIAMTESLGFLIWVEKIQKDILAILTEELGSRASPPTLNYPIKDLRLTGDAITIPDFNSITDDVPLNLIDAESGIWMIELRLRPGGIVFKNRESWYNHWFVDGYPEGNLIHRQIPEDYESFPMIEESGLYRITVNMNAYTYKCEKLND
ncbi:DUF6090 family protein [Robiginitalea sp. IMCC44478]|uniref:DUF6090 family protein n=1 Tax=Robiginitalea sp. IMCC44478 TaxID=3459122 RepID=UPI0040421D5D